MKEDWNRNSNRGTSGNRRKHSSPGLPKALLWGLLDDRGAKSNIVIIILIAHGVITRVIQVLFIIIFIIRGKRGDTLFFSLILRCLILVIREDVEAEVDGSGQPWEHFSMTLSEFREEPPEGTTRYMMYCLLYTYTYT